MGKYIKPSQFESDRYPVTFIVGARGVGKTVNSLAENLERCFKNKTQFIYLRRYQTEIDTLGLNLALLSDLTKHDITIDIVKDDSGRTSKVLLVDGEPVGIMLALSVASKYKSNDYSKVDKIIYDEFIDINGRELKNESFLFINFAMTVFREFDKYKVLFLSNATNLYNCYFLDFEILPKSRITKFRDKGIKVVMYDTSEELDHERRKSVLAKQVALIEGDDGSSLSNKFDNQFNDFLAKLSNNVKYIYTLRLKKVTYALYYDNLQKIYIITNRPDNTNPKKFACRFDDATNEFKVLDYEQFSTLRGWFKNSKLYFTNEKTRSKFIKYLKKGMYSDE